MSRFARNIDANQPLIVAALKKVGALVGHTHTVGGGFPDLVVGYRKRLVMLEIKDGTKVPSARKLTEAEEAFRALWVGAGLPYHVVNSVDEALTAIGAQQ